MIELKIVANDPQDLLNRLSGVAQLLAGTALAPSTEGNAKPATRGRKNQSQSSETASGTTSAAQNAAGEQASASVGQETISAPATNGSLQQVSRETVQPKCVSFGQKAGPQVLKELFVKHGSPQGNWTGVPEENLPALDAELDALLAA